jgi:hypothetical protein
LLKKTENGILVTGPRDEMRVTRQTEFNAGEGKFRKNPRFIHASLMVLKARECRRHFGDSPFEWDSSFGPQPIERYYALTERIRRQFPDGILALDSRHTNYGAGMVYLYEGRPIAYHNWYSGRIFGKRKKVDRRGRDPEWLRTEMARFIKDYWNGTVNLD